MTELEGEGVPRNQAVAIMEQALLAISEAHSRQIALVSIHYNPWVMQRVENISEETLWAFIFSEPPGAPSEGEDSAKIVRILCAPTRHLVVFLGTMGSKRRVNHHDPTLFAHNTEVCCRLIYRPGGDETRPLDPQVRSQRKGFLIYVEVW